MAKTVKVVVDAVIGAGRAAATRVAVRTGIGLGGLAALAGLALLAGAGLGYLYVQHHRAQVESTAKATTDKLLSCYMVIGCDMKSALAEAAALDHDVKSAIKERILNDPIINGAAAASLANCVGDGDCGKVVPQTPAGSAPVAQGGTPSGSDNPNIGGNAGGSGKPADAAETKSGSGGGSSVAGGDGPASASSTGPGGGDNTAGGAGSGPAAGSTPGASGGANIPGGGPTNVATNSPAGAPIGPGVNSNAGGGSPAGPVADGPGGGGAPASGGPGNGALGGSGPTGGGLGGNGAGSSSSDCTTITQALADAKTRLQELIKLARGTPIQNFYDVTALSIRAAGMYQLRTIDRLQATWDKACGKKQSPTQTAAAPPSNNTPGAPGDGGGPGDGSGPGTNGPGDAPQTPTNPNNGTRECADALEALADAKANYDTEEVFLRDALDQQMKSVGYSDAQIAELDQKADLNDALRSALFLKNILSPQISAFAYGLSNLVQKLQKNVADRQAAADKACGKQQSASALPNPTPPPKPETAKCGDAVRQGGDQPESITIPVNGSSGEATLSYSTYDIPDQMQVTVDGKPAADTGCVGNDKAPGSGTGSKSFQIPAGAKSVQVSVNPNCNGNTSGTAWEFKLICPQPVQAAPRMDVAMYAPDEKAGLGPPPNPPTDDPPMGGLGPPPNQPANIPSAPGGTTTALLPPNISTPPISIPVPGAPPNVCNPRPPSKPGNVCNPAPKPANVCNPKPPSSGVNSGAGSTVRSKPPASGLTEVISGGACVTKDGVTTCTDLQGHKCTSKTGSCDPTSQMPGTPPPRSSPLALKPKPGMQVANVCNSKAQTSSVPACASKAPHLPWGGNGSATITVSGGKSCAIGWHDTGATILDSMSVISAPSHGSLKPQDQHLIIFTPSLGYKGQDSFTLSMQEHNNGRRATMRVKVNVTIQ